MARVGICEDDAAIRRVVLEALRLTGHEGVAAHNGGEALRMFVGDSSLEVLVLDIGLPDADGRDVCQALRSHGQTAPVLFLTALGSTHDKLAGFAAGGDDYLAKPFEVKELVARIEAIAQRAQRSATPPSGLLLDPSRHSLRFGDREVLLSPTEYRLLAALTSRPGEVVRRRAVIAAAWPDGAIVSDNTLDSYARRIRHKLELLESPVGLRTVRGVGYTLG